ncbi:MAG: histidinol-phosphate transaminase [Balneolaceae bacterium]
MSTKLKIEIPRHIQQLKPYVAGKTIAEVKDRYKPLQLSKLASNENRLGFSPLVRGAVEEAMQSIQDYPDPVASKLRTAIAKRNDVKESEVMIAAGSESIISILCRTFLSKKDSTITADATFVGFFVQVGVVGAKIKKIPVTDDYRYDVDGILSSIDDETKMVYIANPNNPTGTYLDKDSFAKLINIIPDDVLIIADEAYYEFAKEVKDYPKAMDYRKNNMVILRTFSKAYGLAGFRIGYCIADEEIITQMMKIKLTFEPTALAQAAALAAYSDEEFLDKSIEVVHEGRDELYTFFDEHQVAYARSISNSVMMILDDEQSAINFTQAMLEEGVILRRINAFGLPNCVRITIGTEKEMKHFRESFLKVSAEISV